MSKQKIIYQIDAFTTAPFRGNPAGVCILSEEMPDEWMQNLASELHVSETAFVTKGKHEHKIRYFTPESEIPLCGHATLASAHIMYQTGLVKRDGQITLLSKAGKLNISTHEGWIIMDFPAYQLTRKEIPVNFKNYLGIIPEELYYTDHGWSFALLKTEDEVRNLRPDFNLLNSAGFGEIIVTAPSSDKEFDFCVRCFVPALGINEDPVTGSAHCSLAPFWSNKTGKKRFVSHQVSPRGGILKVELKGDRVEIAGQAITIFRAELSI